MVLTEQMSHGSLKECIMKNKSNLKTLVLAALLLAGCSSSASPVTSITLASEADKVLANENTAISVTTEPKDASLSAEDFTAKGGTITMNGDVAEFKADKPGTYTIWAAADGVTSNKVTIEVEGTDGSSSGQDDTEKTQTDKDSSTGKDSSGKDSTNGAADNKEGTAASSGSASDGAGGTSSGSSSGSQSSGSSSSGSQSSGSSAASGQSAGQNSTAASGVISVKEAITDWKQYANTGKTITIDGMLPQDSTGRPVIQVSADSTSDQEKLDLSGSLPQFGGCEAQLTGTLSLADNGNLVFHVDSSKQITDGTAGKQAAAPDQKQGGSADSAASGVLSVEQAVADWKELIITGKTVTIEGYLPQAARVDKNGKSFACIQASTDPSSAQDWIQLAGSLPDFGGCKAQLTGTMSAEDGGELIFNVQSAKQLQ